ncbi:APC family permease [Alicyclobacillus mali (ex Roth et al. 2021)]|uniref:APC family permease n=1 Tax=Alicyclobacillus mali (ex Roth et al. 2021) TaxID=1123961 RepID=UPI001A8C059C|nr:APC family permease [Alicyclobacillus mali (ex Roth et al. 2021)]
MGIALKKNEISTIEAMAISVAIMAPTAAMALNGALVAGTAGTAVPLTFLLATITIGLVSYAFIQFNRIVPSSGSVYAFTALTLGPRVGFLSGWALLFTYLVFTAASCAEVGAFLQSALQLIGLHIGWFMPSLLSLVCIVLLSLFDVRVGARVMLIFEGISICLIVILSLAILLHGGADHRLSPVPFTMRNTTLPSVALASVFAFLSFAGFEGASSLGEETRDPQKALPLAIGSAVFLTGGFYLLSSYTQTLGFGLSAHDVREFAQSSAPLGILAERYISHGFAAILMLGATLSAFSSALGTATTGSRMLYSMGKSGLLTQKLSHVYPRFGSPYVSLMVVGVIAVGQLFFLRNLSGTTVFGYLGSLGVLSLLLAYLSTNIGYLVFSYKRSSLSVSSSIPALAAVALMYILYANVYPVPPYPSNLFPYIVIAWLFIGIGLMFVIRECTHKVELWIQEEYHYNI